MGLIRAGSCSHSPRDGPGALLHHAIDLHHPLIVSLQVAAEHKKSEDLVARIITAAVQRAHSLNSMNQGLAEQLQRARAEIAQVFLSCTPP